MQTFKNIPALDGFRAFAVILVLLYHARVPGVLGGYIGVDLFFVLSGFLITTILINEFNQKGSVSLKGFYLRRVIRLIPALVFFLAVGLLAAKIILSAAEFTYLKKITFHIATYSYNWVVALTNPVNRPKFALHCWSLSVEEQYYILWPFILCFFLKSNKIRLLSMVLIFCAVVSFALRSVLILKGAPIERVYFATDTRLDGLMLGSLLGILYQHREVMERLFFFKSGVAYVSLLGLGLLTSYANYYDSRSQISAPFLAALFSFCLLGFILLNDKSVFSRFLSTGLMVWVGKLSYSLYLWHYPFFNAMRERLPWQQTLLYAGMATFLCGSLSYYFVEKPFLKMKREIE